MPGTKPDEPRHGFPLYAHSSGKWARKIRGNTHYFGTWTDHQAALDECNSFLACGSKSDNDRVEGITVKQRVNEFMNARNACWTAEILASRHFKIATTTKASVEDVRQQ
jgi:hypothetical protein